MIPPNLSLITENVKTSVPTLTAIYALRLFEKIVFTQQEDPLISRDAIRLREMHERGPATSEEETFLQNHRIDGRGFWRRDSTDNTWRIQVPATLRERVIREYHDTPLSGHPGADETIRSIREFFFWPGMARETRRYVAGCHLCIFCKPVHGQRPPGQRPRPSQTSWETVAVDFMGPYRRTSQDNSHIMVVTDLFTRWVEAFPLRVRDAPRATRLLEEQVFSRYGYPRRILSDNGPQFTGSIWAEASRRWDCELWTTPVYHPRENPTERRNQEIKKGLRLRLHQGNQRTWDRFLPELLFGLRRRRNAATNVTPSHLFGKTIARPGEWRFTHLFPPET